VWFDLGSTEPDRLGIEADLDPADPQLRLIFYTGTPQTVLGVFLRQTGPAVAPPDWVFRPWMSGNEWDTQERVLAEVQRSREHEIPVGVVVVEAWSDESTFSIFRDAQYQPHPDGAPHELADFRFPVGGAWPDPKAVAGASVAGGAPSDRPGCVRPSGDAAAALRGAV
jgi:alpha-glucosidase (family GH31 glycosyl hydrolase)